MSKKLIKTAFYGMISSFLTWPMIAIGAEPTPPSGGPTTIEDLYNKFLTIMRWVFGFALALAMIMIVWGGITYMTAGGDEEKVGAAKKRVIWGLVGAAIIIATWAILTIIKNWLGITVTLPT